MIKQYRLRRLNNKLAEYQAKYNELSSIFDGVSEIPQYYIDKRIEYAGIIATIKDIIKNLDTDNANKREREDMR